MIELKGHGSTSGELPIDLAGARAYFADVPAFLAKLEAVDAIKPLSRPGAFLVTHHPMGALGYHVRMVAVLQCDWDETGLRLAPLDFDTAQVPSELPVVKGFINGHLRLGERPGDRTEARLDFTVQVDLPIPSALRLVPRALVQATGDGIMGLQTSMVVSSLFRRVMDDFALVPSS